MASMEHDPVAASLPYDRTGAHMKGVQMFVQRTYEMVSSLATEYCVSWADDGRSFILSDYAAVEEELPNFFTSGKISSFIRQLNMYSFRKRGEKGHWEYAHPFFLRGRTDLLRFIKRQKKKRDPKPPAPTGAPMDISSTSSLTTTHSRAPSPSQPRRASKAEGGVVDELRSDLAQCRATLKSFQAILDERNAQVAALQNELVVMRSGVSSILTDQKVLLSQFEAVQSAFLAVADKPVVAVGAKRKREPEEELSGGASDNKEVYRETLPSKVVAPSPSLMDLFPQISPRTHTSLPRPSSSGGSRSGSSSASAKNPKPFPKISTAQVPSSSVFRAPKRVKPLHASGSSSRVISVEIPHPRPFTSVSQLSLTPRPATAGGPGESPSFADILALITPTLSQIFEAPPPLDL